MLREARLLLAALHPLVEGIGLRGERLRGVRDLRIDVVRRKLGLRGIRNATPPRRGTETGLSAWIVVASAGKNIGAMGVQDIGAFVMKVWPRKTNVATVACAPKMKGAPRETRQGAVRLKSNMS